MKRILITILFGGLAAALPAQVQVKEPEYIGQVIMITSDTTGVTLAREAVQQQVKSTHFGAIPLPGTGLLDKTRMSSVLQGAASANQFDPGEKQFIIRVERNDQDPATQIAIWQMTVKKKTREHKAGEVGILTGASMNITGSDVPIQAEKYGTSSYKVQLPALPPGEYAITIIGEPQVSTFSIR